MSIKKTKVTLLFLLLLFVGATTAQNQMVNFTNSTKTIIEILADIETQTQLSVDYNLNDLSKIASKKVQVKSGSVESVLKQVFQSTNLTYIFDSEHIIITTKGLNTTNSQSNLQQVEVSGVVVDESGDPIIGAIIMEKGTQNGSRTDMDGGFKMLVDKNAKVVISYLGYKAIELVAEDANNIKVQLEEDNKLLDEVIVIGYGSTSVKKNVSSVTALKGEKLQDLPFSSVNATLQGRASGVIVQASGGEPGSVPSISIRGGGEPIYVIDGIISNAWDFQTLQPNDIESLSILKDAASLAVYGARAANGIVLVKTKEGKEGKTAIVYSFNGQFSKPAVLPKKIDSYTYARVQNDVAKNDGFGDYYSYSKEEMDIIANQTDPYKYSNTDWLDLGLKNFTPEYRHSLSMTGSQKNINYYMSLGLFDQGSIYKSNALNYKRYNLRNNVNTSFDEIGLKVGLNVNASMEKKKYPSFGAGQIWDHLFSRSPLQPAYNPDGTLSSISDHPLMEMSKNSGYDKNEGSFLNTQLTANWALPWVEGLSLGTMFYYRVNSSHAKKLSARATQYNQDGTIVDTEKPSLKESAYFGEGYDLELNTSFLRTFAQKHTIDGKVVFTASERDGYDFWASRRNYLSTQVDQLFAGASEGMQNYGNADERGRLGLVTRLKYDYAMRYYLEGSFRYDGSDNFAPGHRWGFFPSIAGAWDITEEPFFKGFNIKDINLLKLRASYGQIGTESGVSRFGYLSVYNLVENAINIGGNLQPGFSEGDLVSPELMTWYTTNSLNYGLDFSFLKSRLSGTAEYFYYVTKGGLMRPADRYTTPLGKPLPLIKSDSESRREGFELSLRWSDNINKEFTYEIGTNMTYYNSLWVKNASESISTLKNPYQRDTHQAAYYGLLFLDNGLYQNPNQILNSPRPLGSTGLKMGDIAYRDINGDGKIDDEDRVRHGMPSSPHFTYGIDFNFGYKGFSLSGLLYGTGKRDMMMGVNYRNDQSIYIYTMRHN